MVWAGLLENPLEVVCWRPRRTLVATRGDQDVSQAGATCLPVMAIVMVVVP
jgi:hypothetical protein